MRALVGVDIGTQGTKAALFDEDGRCLATAFEPSRLHQPRPGVVEEDPERQFASVCRTIKRCMKSSRVRRREVLAIGIDGQMAGVIGIGRDGRAVTPYDSWLDTRCAPQIRQMQDHAGQQITAKCGGAPSFNHGPKTLWWKQTQPRVYAKIAAFVQPGGYAAMRLCDLPAGEAFIDHTYLHFSGFADNPGRKWDPGIIAAFGFDGEKLPRIVAPEQIVGALSPTAARACGLQPDVRVVAGCGDTAASFLACGAVQPGICVDVAGTASVFAATTSQFRADLATRTLGCGQSAVPGLWHPYAYINGGGMNVEWFVRELTAAGKRDGRNARLEALNRAAGQISASPALPMFIPHMGGRVCPPQPQLRGGWVGLAWDHTAGHLYRAVLESVALEYMCYARILRGIDPSFELRELRVTGGGEKSQAWNQIKANALQSPVVRIAGSEGAPRGAAMLAGVGAGVLTDLPTTARQWIKSGSKTRPQKRDADYYVQRQRIYESLLQTLDGALAPPET